MQRAVDEFEGAHGRCPGNDDFAPLLKQFAAAEKATTVQFGALANGNCAFEFTLHGNAAIDGRSEEHTSELQSLMRISYAVFCLKKKKRNKTKRKPSPKMHKPNQNNHPLQYSKQTKFT